MARLLAPVVLIAALATAVLVPTGVASAKTAPTTDPTSNRLPSQAFVNACVGMGTSKSSNDTCDAAARSDFTAAWAAEGIGSAFALPADFDTLSVPAQLLAISDVERVGRGEPPVTGMSSSLDALAQAGADNDADPRFPSQFPGTSAGSNWASAGNSALLDDFYWMYDDGIGSPNGACSGGNTSGCWGHRNNIVGSYDTPIVMGAAVAYNTSYGSSLAAEYIGGDTTDTADVPPTWATISASTPSSAPVQLSSTSIAVSADTAASASGTVTVTAPSGGATVTDAIASGSSAWSVTPASCSLSAGASCTLHLTFDPAVPGTVAGALSVTDGTGSQSVALTGTQVAPQVVVDASAAKVKPGDAVTLIATVTSGVAHDPLGGELVELQSKKGSGTWSDKKQKTSKSDGDTSFTRHPKRTIKYRAVVRTPTGQNEATSASVKVKVS